MLFINLIIIIVYIICKFEVKQNQDARNDLTIKHGTEPDIFNKIIIKLTLEKYLCLMASVLSIWFGFSIILFTKFVSEMFIKIKINYFTNANVNVIVNSNHLFAKRVNLIN